jgi:hypothetical protein
MLQRAIRHVFGALAAYRESGEAEVDLRVQFVEVREEGLAPRADRWRLGAGAALRKLADLPQSWLALELGPGPN